MATVNIKRGVSDQFYRYKMPRIIAKVEGKGNGIKTVIVNMPEVAKALSRPPTYPTKYFGCELGAQTQFDVKNDRYIVNGAHDMSKLQDLLDGFIKKFVLCPECDNPETNLIVRQKQNIIIQRCIACGYSGDIDMRHKLTTYILKNPPDQPSTTTPSKKEKRAKKGKSKEKEAVNGEQTESPESPRESDDVNVEAPPEVAEENNANSSWGEEISQEAVQQRMEELSGAAKKLALSEELEKSQDERLDIFYDYLKSKKEAGEIAGNDKEIFAEAERLEVKDKGPLVLCELLLDSGAVQQIKTYRTLFLRFTHANPKAQKYIMGAFEQLIKQNQEALLPKTAHILKAFYDTDILDEEIIIKWGEKISKKYVSKELAQEIHAKASPFIKWLKEAEEESEESDDEEGEDVEIVYSNTEKVGSHTVPNKSKEGDDEAEEDDFDIDAI